MYRRPPANYRSIGGGATGSGVAGPPYPEPPAELLSAGAVRFLSATRQRYYRAALSRPDPAPALRQQMEREVAVSIKALRRELLEGLGALLLYAEAALPHPERVLGLADRYATTAEYDLPNLAAALENDVAAARLYLRLTNAEGELLP